MWSSAVVKYIRIGWRMFLANLSSAVSFRFSFVLHIIGVIGFYGGQFFLWTVFFNQFPLVGGWTTKDVILVYSLFLFSSSLLDVFAGGVFDIAKIINAGGLDYYLVFPKPVLWHIAVSKSDVISLGTTVLSLSYFIFSAPFEPIRFFLFFVAACFSIILMFNFIVISGSLAFFIGGFDQGANLMRHLLSIVSSYPFSIFPRPFNYFLMTIIPSFFIVTLPAQLVAAFSFKTIFVLTSACIISSFLAHIVFKKGLKKYESGSLINVKM